MKLLIDIPEKYYKDALRGNYSSTYSGKTIFEWLRNAKPADTKWIPVTERLPETRDEVLISLADGRITIASYNDHFLPFFNKSIGWGVDAKRFVFDFCSDDVTAWMPLPESYTEVKDE